MSFGLRVEGTALDERRLLHSRDDDTHPYRKGLKGWTSI
jgi:hypothetical protein